MSNQMICMTSSSRPDLYLSDLNPIYLDAWTANLGVVPLFLLAAFLFEPAFFFFLNLLFSVTHVLETIVRLLFFTARSCKINTNKFKSSFVPTFSPCVKGFLILTLLTQGFFLMSKSLYASDRQSIVLAKGESTVISTPQFLRFNVGNPEVVKYRYDATTKGLHIRGLKLGHSEIIVWNSLNKIIRYQVFIISKIEESKLLKLTENISQMGLQTEMTPPYIRVSGVIKNMKQYLHFKKLYKTHSEVILDESQVDKLITKEIFAAVYKPFLTNYMDSVKCESQNSLITCFHADNQMVSESTKKHLENKFLVEFIPYSAQQTSRNFRFKMKLIQLEQLDGEDMRLGLNELNTNLSELMTMPLTQIVSKNSILLSAKKMTLNTLAEPEALLRPMTPAEFQIGAEIPYQSTQLNTNITQTSWQFAGLKINVKIENLGPRILIHYETQLTKPENNESSSIAGSKEKSSLIVNINQPIKAFQIMLKTEANQNDQLPYLNRIPILGELFKSKSKQSTFKTITAIMEVSHDESTI